MSRFNAAYVEQVNDSFLVWRWQPRWNRYVNSHMFDDQGEATFTVKVLNKPPRKRK